MPVLTRAQSQILRPRYDLTNGLVAWYPLIDGRANDFSGQNIQGTLVGSPTATGGIFRDPSGRSGAIKLNGSSQAISLPNTGLLRTSAITISAWIYLDALPANNGDYFTIAKSFVTGAENRVLYVYKSGGVTNLAFLIYNLSPGAFAANTALNSGRWYHAVGVYDGAGKMTVYLDGKNDGSLSNTGSQSLSASSSFYIGTTSGTANWFNGRIADVRIYNRALSPGEVFSLYASAFQPVDSLPQIIPPSGAIELSWADFYAPTATTPTTKPFPINIPMLGF